MKAGELSAVQELWHRYKWKLLEVANRQIANLPSYAADEEDVAQSVFTSLWRGAAAGRFDDIHNRDDLWWLLLAITKQKVVDLRRREGALKRGGDRVRIATAETGEEHAGHRIVLDQLIADEPTPEFLVSMAEEHGRLLGLLRDDRLRRIAVSRIEGFTVQEIATDLAVSTRSIERKLQLIRSMWSKEFGRVEWDSD